MEVFDRQQILDPCGHPVPRRRTLAFGAVPVLARVVGDVMVPAFGAACYMPAERLGPTGFNRRHYFELGEADMPRIGLPPRGAMGTEDVSDLQLRAGHWPRALFQPSSQGLILQQLHLFERADRAADRLGRYTGVARRGRQLGVLQQYLDHPHIGIGLKQMRGKAVPHRVKGASSTRRVQCRRFADPRHMLGGGERPVQLARRE